MPLTIFNKLHSKYYDLIYGKKDYAGEALFFSSLLKKYGRPGAKTLASFGAGTLNHERCLLKKGYTIHGVDFSKGMVALARQKIKKERLRRVTIEHGDIRSWQTDKKFDAALSMFNVIGYCKNLKELEAVFITAARALKPKAVFIFDCWNAGAVKKDPPKTRFVKFRRGPTELYRLTDATPFGGGETINLKIELMEIKSGKITGRETEKHRVRAWKLGDIRKILRRHGFKLALACQFGNAKLPISDKKWAMAIVAKKP
ncbi:MAG: class I SAM-dependent methyltransferase [Candidatus Taylorbacteria bacterium]|nr:class I SAM-dependent methyltransferase [Candidatus Taylorbacteria bacterium]